MFNFDEVIDRKNTNSLKWNIIDDKDMLPMWVADMEFKSPKAVRKALKERVEHGIFGYSEISDSYYQAIIQWMKKRHQWDIKKEWICTSPGVVPALNMLVRCLTNSGDKVIIQPPVYYPFFDAIKNNGCHIVDNPLQFDGTRYTMDLDDLEKKIDSRVKLMMLCSPHNPVGRVWTPEELKRLGELCIKNNVIVIADEIHSDLIFEEYEHTVFASISEEFKQNCIVCNAPSKTFNLAGIQASNIIIPNKRIRTLYQHSLEQTRIGRLNAFAVTALEAAYNYGEEWLEELLVYLEDNFDFLCNYITEEIPQINVIQPEGTYLVWLDFRSLGLEDEVLNDLIQKEGKLVLNPGHIFGTGGSGFQRINIACPRSMLKEGLTRLKKVVNHL
ncbi:aminotransferase class I and II [Acetohalobium arabaticum DSM 5501]|uniref:cysteine-S-conjugate beta-lyase n=2 Tax=Acetohalobium TaxID=28186 RepID=D9QUG9_ACEAZ|nr:MalY/PatB family protein [Acetohalobium arabaticum]ADL13770.1 aminotransferase class I and II [Acetohalobium arabaticum DSM 5501]